MSLYQALIRPLMFSLDAEAAHNLALGIIARGWARGSSCGRGDLKRTLFGVEFPHPVGLAAGFDKNGAALARWKKLGFGFVEVGTVTRHAQPGNPKPRMFRLLSERGIINRLGFNNEGADALARRLDEAQAGIPVGVNLGKSKVTPLEEAAEDYAYSYRLLKDKGDYFVVNVSSPNTPGLRQLQDRDALTRILWRLKEIDAGKPLFVKIAPDLSDEALAEVVEAAIDLQLTGLIATNTTLDRTVLPRDPGQDGGLSGAPLTKRADNVLQRVKSLAGDQLTLIGVGGIMSPEDAQRKLDLGASLVQVYSGWVYGGPGFVSELVRGLKQHP
jgi:dihydroorotate dehydrogenase